eukprot:TRINITY_DN10189_c0_g5_i1.p1 TRINITY_DN10189_c0_g5~~TRINITY_DN10189_c0_g5_i1.p1  ORF type:complete len:668 (+),score=130.01 TRINITY_DN10189_c0_g5_i1:256-2004(+)
MDQCVGSLTDLQNFDLSCATELYIRKSSVGIQAPQPPPVTAAPSTPMPDSDSPLDQTSEPGLEGNATAEPDLAPDTDDTPEPGGFDGNSTQEPSVETDEPVDGNATTPAPPPPPSCSLCAITWAYENSCGPYEDLVKSHPKCTAEMQGCVWETMCQHTQDVPACQARCVTPVPDTPIPDTPKPPEPTVGPTPFPETPQPEVTPEPTPKPEVPPTPKPEVPPTPKPDVTPEETPTPPSTPSPPPVETPKPPVPPTDTNQPPPSTTPAPPVLPNPKDGTCAPGYGGVIKAFAHVGRICTEEGASPPCPIKDPQIAFDKCLKDDRCCYVIMNLISNDIELGGCAKDVTYINLDPITKPYATCKKEGLTAESCPSGWEYKAGSLQDDHAMPVCKGSLSENSCVLRADTAYATCLAADPPCCGLDTSVAIDGVRDALQLHTCNATIQQGAGHTCMREAPVPPEVDTRHFLVRNLPWTIVFSVLAAALLIALYFYVKRRKKASARQTQGVRVWTTTDLYSLMEDIDAQDSQHELRNVCSSCDRVCRPGADLCTACGAPMSDADERKHLMAGTTSINLFLSTMKKGDKD